MLATNYTVVSTPEIARTDNLVPFTKLAERIKFLRTKHGYSQTDVAKELGISQPAYRKYENGGGVESSSLLALCRLYSVSADYMLGLVDQPADHVEEERLPPHERKLLESIREYLRSGKNGRLIRYLFGNDLDMLDDKQDGNDNDSNPPALKSGE